MDKGVNFIKNVDDIPIYNDSNMNSNSYLVMYKGNESINPGLVYVPTKIWNKGMKTCKGAAFDQKEVNEILRGKSIKKFSDIKAIICNNENPGVIEKIIGSLYQNFR